MMSWGYITLVWSPIWCGAQFIAINPIGLKLVRPVYICYALAHNEIYTVVRIINPLHHYHHQVVSIAWFSLTLFCHLSLSIMALDSTQYPHRANGCKFLLVSQHWGVHVYVGTGEHCLWICPCFSSRCLVHLTWMLCEMRGKWPYSCCFLGATFMICSKTIWSILE